MYIYTTVVTYLYTMVALWFIPTFTSLGHQGVGRPPGRGIQPQHADGQGLGHGHVDHVGWCPRKP